MFLLCHIKIINKKIKKDKNKKRKHTIRFRNWIIINIISWHFRFFISTYHNKSIISWSTGLLRPSVSVGKMPITQGGIRWRWLEYQCLSEIMFLSRNFGTWFRKLAWIFVIVTFRPVIVWRINTKQLSNLPTGKIAFEFWGWKDNWKVLILQRWTCLKEPKFLLMRACALTTEGYGTNVKI